MKVFVKRYLTLPLWLWLLLGLIVLFRIPSLFEPFNYGDELIYLTLGEGIRRGLVLYRDIFDHKTPFLYYTAALAGNVFWFRFLLGVVMLLTTVLYYKLITIIFPKNGHVRFFTVLVFVILTTLPLWEGQIANAELFMTLPTISGLLLLAALLKKSDKQLELKPLTIFSSGILFAIATLFKVPALFEAGIVIYMAFLVYTTPSLSLSRFIKFIFLWGAGFVIPILLTGIWFWYRGALADYIFGGLLINLGYISAFRPGDAQEPFLVRNAPLLLRGGILLVSVVILYLLKSKLSKTFIFLSAWLLFSLFAVTLSERPYPHYLLQLAPSIAGLIGMLIASRTKEQVYTIFPLTLAFFAMSYFHFWYYPTSSYYQRFVEYISGNITQKEYLDRFDGEVIRDYEISRFINNNTRESDYIFTWGDFSNVYAVSKRLPPLRYLTSFHINDFYSQEMAISDLISKPPKFVVIFPNSPPFPGLQSFLSNYSYTLVREIDGVEIWQVQ